MEISHRLQLLAQLASTVIAVIVAFRAGQLQAGTSALKTPPTHHAIRRVLSDQGPQTHHHNDNHVRHAPERPPSFPPPNPPYDTSDLESKSSTTTHPVPPRPAPVNAHRWEETSPGVGSWKCISHCDELPCQNKSVHPMVRQYEKTGFVVLQDLLPEKLIDRFAADANDYIARKGRLLTWQDPSHCTPGYLVPALPREPELAHLFELLHGNQQLHEALAHVFHSPRPPMRSNYRLMKRSELTIDRSRPWHQDGLAFTPTYGDQNLVASTLLNVAVYLQDSITVPSLEIVPGGHAAPCEPGSAYDRPSSYKLFTRRGDAVIFNFRNRHRSGDMNSRRRINEPTTAVPHRTLLNLGYGPDTPATELLSRGFELRDLLLTENKTYACNFVASGKCGRGVSHRNWRRIRGG